MAATSRAFIISRVTYRSPKPQQPPPAPPPSTFYRHCCLSPRRPAFLSTSSSSTVSCLSSGGGVSDEFVSTRKSSFDRGFSVISNMLKRIEPLDNATISKGVSDSAKDSMKQTISTMLGLLPSDQFSVTITVSKHPLDRLLVSAIITGYTLWNAEYRISLMRNLEISVEDSKKLDSSREEEGCGDCSEEGESGSGCTQVDFEDFEISPRVLGDLSPEALSYVQQLKSELAHVNDELNTRKQETLRIEHDKGNRNDLLEYLRSLDSDMVMELSRPSSVEVEDIIHQLVRNVSKRFFNDDSAPNFLGHSITASEDHQESSNEVCETVDTSRDYLAKLLFWCMLLGHHLRGLENRLHLSCVVGLL
ncbi:hypothetical protein K2173_019958 [Erythroxylum novogranatense]|uniref:Seed maturation-like protein n=1 Tax=Erythroxylum novogranatense TaxID=1862640 RepID=A0AAV8U9W1_9ROSI|nr:hypothetical protein K2173_019958 [Erythroxylum novogranatense]